MHIHRPATPPVDTIAIYHPIPNAHKRQNSFVFSIMFDCVVSSNFRRTTSCLPLSLPSLSLYLSIIPSPIPFSILFHFPNSPIYLFLGATIGPICTDTIHFISFRVICCLCNDAAQMNSIAPYLERKIELMPDVLVSPYFNCLCKSIKFSCTTPRMRLIEIMALCI